MKITGKPEELARFNRALAPQPQEPRATAHGPDEGWQPSIDSAWSKNLMDTIRDYENQHIGIGPISRRLRDLEARLDDSKRQQELLRSRLVESQNQERKQAQLLNDIATALDAIPGTRMEALPELVQSTMRNRQNVCDALGEWRDWALDLAMSMCDDTSNDSDAELRRIITHMVSP